MTVTVEVPEGGYDANGLDLVRRAAEEAFVAEGVRLRRLSPAQGASMLGLNRWSMMELLARHQVPLSEDSEVLEELRNGLDGF